MTFSSTIYLRFETCPWCNGNITVSKTVVGGSSPSGYAKLGHLNLSNGMTDRGWVGQNTTNLPNIVETGYMLKVLNRMVCSHYVAGDRKFPYLERATCREQGEPAKLIVPINNRYPGRNRDSPQPFR